MMKQKKMEACIFALVMAVVLFAGGCSVLDVPDPGKPAESAKDGADEEEPVESAKDGADEEEPVESAKDEADAEETAESAKDEANAEESAEEDPDTGDASGDDPRNQDGIGENELLVVSFGTSYNDSRRLTIGAIEEAMEEAFSEYGVRRGFTSKMVISHIEKRDGEKIDNVEEALDRARENGVRRLVVQPTHLMDGFEYNELAEAVSARAGDFQEVSIGKPLLYDEEDLEAVAGIMISDTKGFDDGNTAICFMGHGTEADSNKVYGMMLEKLREQGAENVFVATVEAAPSFDDLLEFVRAGGYERVVLQPLMVVAGDHASNDMAGPDDDSWKSMLEKEGYEVVPVLRGLGEIEGIREIYVDHARKAIEEA